MSVFCYAFLTFFIESIVTPVVLYFADYLKSIGASNEDLAEQMAVAIESGDESKTFVLDIILAMTEFMEFKRMMVQQKKIKVRRLFLQVPCDIASTIWPLTHLILVLSFSDLLLIRAHTGR